MCFLPSVCSLPPPVLGIVVGARTRGTLDLSLPWSPESLHGGGGESAQILASVCPVGPKVPSRLTLPITPSTTAWVLTVQGHDQAPGGGLASCHHLSPLSDAHPVWVLTSLFTPRTAPPRPFDFLNPSTAGTSLGLPPRLPAHTQGGRWRSPPPVTTPPFPWGPRILEPHSWVQIQAPTFAPLLGA